jgi:hypothetical protein
MDFVIVLVVLALVVIFVSAPFRRPSSVQGASANGAGSAATASEVAELQAAREAKYREIRDAELDHRTGKLSDADYEAVDGSLRAEAIDILHRLDSISRR